MSLTIKLTVNGNTQSATAEPSTSLLDFLRDTLNYKGTKLCCNTGECGACTIIYNGKPINSCVTLAADANGAEIVTIEGLADGDKLHPVQQAFIDTGAVQCGYCTPGYIISVKVLLDRTKEPTPEDIEEAVSGTICRCTGATAAPTSTDTCWRKTKSATWVTRSPPLQPRAQRSSSRRSRKSKSSTSHCRSSSIPKRL